MSLSFLVYDIIIRVYVVLIHLASLFNAKARLWTAGRKNWQAALEASLPEQGVDIWMHCASLGEFEQGRPVLEALRRAYPEKYILLTFFSPSGYEVRKNYAIVNHVCYLPADTGINARRFIGLARPQLVIFIKYEFWFHFLTALHRRKIPVLLLSAVFRPRQLFFRWYGKAFSMLLSYFQKIFVQDELSAGILQRAGINDIIIAGDTRFDRVTDVAARSKEIPAVKAFLGDRPAWIAGSTWPKDEQLIRSAHDPAYTWIIAPHEIHEEHLRQIENLFPGRTVRYSSLTIAPGEYTGRQVLLIDNIGMLSSLYRYGIAAYIGGGFNSGIHNILEAAVYGIPVVFGPAYHKFREATDLVSAGGAFSVNNEEAWKAVLEKLSDNMIRKEAGNRCSHYVKNKTGATKKIMAYIQEKRFLTK